MDEPRVVPFNDEQLPGELGERRKLHWGRFLLRQDLQTSSSDLVADKIRGFLFEQEPAFRVNPKAGGQYERQI
jgi:hypothetical protein